MNACHKSETTVVLEKMALTDMVYLTDEATDSLTIDIEMEYPTKIYPDSVLQLIQSDLKNHLFGEAYAEMEPQQAIEAYCAMLKTEYKANNLPILEDYQLQAAPDDEDGRILLCEEQYLSGSVMGIVKDILSYGVERYVYLGGPHGNNYRLFLNFDLRTGRTLSEEDIFTEGYEEPLTELLLHYMVEQNDEVDLIKDLELAGYNVDDIHPNDNFYLADEGITYVFNPYDIAPYAFGETEILIPWDDVKPLLRDFVLEDHRFSLKKLF